MLWWVLVLGDGSSGKCFSVMPVLKQPSQTGRFQLYVFSPHPVRMKKTTEEGGEEDEYCSVRLRNDPHHVRCVDPTLFRAAAVPLEKQNTVLENHRSHLSTRKTAGGGLVVCELACLFTR